MSETAPENFDPDDIPEYLEARLDSISVTNVGFILFLRVANEARVLPIFVGANEAQAIALALNEDPPPRPLTHDLMKTMLESLEVAVKRVEITEIRDGTFHGRIHLEKAGFEELEYDARPSDAIALALRWEAPLFVERKVFEEAAVPVAAQTEDSETLSENQETKATDEALATAFTSPADKLQEELEAALRAERYEEAARLRDAIKRMQLGN